MNASEPDRVRASWTKIIACLEAQRMRIHAEITGYPMPIPACDAHFNRLLEERAHVCAELERAHAAAAAATHADSREDIKIYLKSVKYISEAVKQEIAMHL